ncbi:CotH kinase family protein [Blastopirellula retiformator]|uniref:CotH protein n=1 Tax=Blastopirellula retiformator TaxID=2527970 RepID=A0A5C5V1B8_9BACT|nr:CotH kinase family protein [Blastopirellula retiformator]TWT31799.1 CotH protein [Blastopirellula retiformator]
MMRYVYRIGLMLLLAFLTTAAVGQGAGGFPGFGGPGGPGGNRADRELVEEYDRDENGWLNQQERAEARAEVKSAGNRRGGFGGGRGRGGNRPAAEPGPKLSPADVENFPDAKWYDPYVLRTIFLEFENDDWEQELEDFHDTDVEAVATLTVDGKSYQNVGIRFRGASSYFMVPAGYKRSLNVSLDLADEDQRLHGYKTLNLLNGASDASFMSTVLYSQIAREFIPAPKANHVRVVINGESWGVYTNVQQFDKDFLKENYPSSKGTRWKVSGSPNGDGGLRYLGEDVDQYKSRYDMKSSDGAKAWAALIRLCRTLNETPAEQLEAELAPMLDIDETLKFLALDVALVNSDGYWTRASDYYIFLDKEKQFHVIPHDMNEAFQGGRGPGGRGPGGPRGPGRFGPPAGPDGDGGPMPPEGRPDVRRPEDGERGRQRGRGMFGGFGFGFGGPGGPGGPGGHGGVELDPLVSLENPRMPLRSRLLALPHLREKYLAYVREIAEKTFAPEHVEPIIARHAELIAADIANDTRKLESLEAFEQATAVKDPGEGSLLNFLQKRREYLLNYQPPAAK